MKQVSVVPDAYFDSVFLMSVASKLRQLAGVHAGMIVLGTPANREAMTQLGFDAPPWTPLTRRPPHARPSAPASCCTGCMPEPA